MRRSAEEGPNIAVADAAPTPLRSFGDPLIADASYLGIVTLTGRQLGENDIIAMLIVMLLVLPGTVTFRRFSWAIFQKLVLRWAVLVGLLVVVATLVDRILYRTTPLLEPHFIAEWSLVALAALLVTHASTALLAPLLDQMTPKRSAVIVGVNPVALRVGASLARGERPNERLLGYFEDRSNLRSGLEDSHVHLGGLGALGDYVKLHRVGIIYICLPMSRSPRLLALLRELQDTTANVCFLPDLLVSDVINGRIGAVAGFPTLSVSNTPIDGLAAVTKRTLDLLVSFCALPIVLPLALVIAVAIRTTSPGPVTFKQRRFGLDGTEIVVWKFRTMRTLEDGDRTYRQVTRNDDRVTAIGRFLRASSLDELPQLLNVIEGTMSIVGPRPHALAVNEQFRKLIPGYMLRHKIKPGITGWAQVHGHRGGDSLDAMRKRTEFDLQYLRTWSIGLDLLIIWKTIMLLARGDNHAY